MALTARFTADFSQFEAAINAAEVEIATFEKGVRSAAADLARMASSFSGAEIQRQAALTANAIERIGGASKLTANEQRAALATIDQAIAKYKALGETAPAALEKMQRELQQLQTAQKSAGEGIGGLIGKLGPLGPAMAGAFSVGTVINFGKAIIDLGGEISDMAARTGFGIEEVQELKYAAEQTGSSLDTFAGASVKLTDKLAAGDKSTVGALKKLGLSYEALASMKPADAFSAVADAIGKMPNELDQTSTALDLFGKSGAEVLPAIKAGFSDLRDQARKTGQVLSEEDVAALDDFGDAWDTMLNRLKVGTATVLLDIGRGFQSVFNDIKTGMPEFTKMELPDWAQQASRGGLRLAFQVVGLGDVLSLAERGASLRQWVNETDKVISDLAKRAAAENEKVLGGSTKRLTEEQRRLREEAEKAAAAQAAATQRGADFLSGAQQAKELQQLQREWNLLSTAQKNSEGAITRMLAKLKPYKEAMGQLPPTLEDWYQEHQKLLPVQQQHLTMLGKMVYGLRDVTNMAQQARNNLIGLRADGLLPATSTWQQFGVVVEKATVHSKNFSYLTAEAIPKTVDWSRGIGDLARSFATLSQNAGDGFGGVAQAIGTLVSGFDAALTAGKSFSDGLGLVMEKGSKNLAAGLASLASGIVGGFGAIMGSTNTESRMQNIIGGALTGAASGASMGLAISAAIAGSTMKGAAVAGIWGAAAGAIIGIFIGVFRGRSTMRLMEKVGEEWGVAITKGTAEKIKTDAAETFKGEDVAAALYNFSSILEEAGGVTADNFDQLIGRLRDVFVMVDRGLFTSSQAAKVLDENFGAFAEHVVSSGKLASAQFLELIELSQRLGVESQAIRDFVTEGAGRVGGGVEAMAGPVTTAVAELEQKLTDAQKNVEALGAAGKKETKEYAAAVQLVNALTTQQGQQAQHVAGELERLGVVALAGFNAAVKGGADYLTAMQQIGPGLDALITAQQTLGLTSENAALAELQHFRDRITANETLVASAGALNETLLALQQIGGLSAESFAALQAQGVETFNRLEAAGFTENERLRQMARFLETVEAAHEQMGFPIDETTQALINQAREAGVLAEKTKSTTDILKEGFGQLTDAINNLADQLGKGLPQAAKAAADGIQNTLGKTRVRVPVDFDYGTAPPTTTHGPVPTNAPSASGYTQVNLNVDGRTFADVIAPHIPGAVEAYGVR